MTTFKTLTTITDLPSPKGHPVFGHIKEFKANNKHQVLEQWAKECGDIYKIRLVNKSFIVSTDPKLNKTILDRRPQTFRRFHKINEIMEEMGIMGVFNAEGETWKRHRKPISEALNMKKIHGFFPVLLNKTQNLIEKWITYSEEQTVVNVQKELMNYTIDITTALAFGYDLDTINNKEDELQTNLEHIFPMINERITAPIPLWRLYKQKKDKQLDKALLNIESIINEVIKSTKRKLKQEPSLKENPSNFLEALIVEQDNNGKFSDEDIYSNVFSIMLAGEDTTSNSIAWALYFLAQYPEYVDKIREEAINTFDGGLFPKDSKMLNKLKFTHAVIQESLRLKPVTPNLYLQANETIIIENLEILKGTTVMLQNKVAQTKGKYFTNPDVFSPNRWLASECPFNHNHSPDIMRTFGAGPRFCPGKNLAIYEMLISLSSICCHFNLKLAAKPQDVKEHFAFTMYPKHLPIKLTPLN